MTQRCALWVQVKEGKPGTGRQLSPWLRLVVKLVLVLVVARLGYYNRRDTFMHWIRRDQRARRPCGHACCRGMRAHPEHWPVNPPNKYLRRATDNELADFYQRAGGGDSKAEERAREQVFAELQRRDLADERRKATQDAYRARVLGKKTERAAEVNRAIDAAEDGTNGYMLNRRGKEAGISERSLFTGPEARAKKYASEELLNWWETHPRPTEAHFRGEDTRIGYATVRGKRRQLTSEEAAWRDRYERDIGWPIEHGRHAEAA